MITLRIDYQSHTFHSAIREGKPIKILIINMKKLFFVLICFLTVGLAANAQTKDVPVKTKLAFEVGGKLVETLSPREVTIKETTTMLATASYQGRGGIGIPVHIYHYNSLNGDFYHAGEGMLYCSPRATLGDIIDFILAIWDYL
ncbi:MAG: hypothetical protein ACLGH8_15810 [Bacteroidia bacterium]